MSSLRASAHTVEFVSLTINEMYHANGVVLNGKEVEVPRQGFLAEAAITAVATVVGAALGLVMVGVGFDLATAKKVRGKWVAILKDEELVQGEVEKTSLTGALMIRGEGHRPSPNMIWLDGRTLHIRVDGYVLGLVQAAIESKSQVESLAASAQAAMDQADAEAQAARAKAEAEVEAAKATTTAAKAAASRAEVEAAKAKAEAAEAKADARDAAKALKAEAAEAKDRYMGRIGDLEAELARSQFETACSETAAKALEKELEAAQAQAQAQAPSPEVEAQAQAPVPSPEVLLRHMAEEDFLAACLAAKTLGLQLPQEFERLMGALLLLSAARDEGAPKEAFAALNHTRGLALGEVRAHGPSGIPEVDEAFREMEAAAKAARAARKAVA